MRRLLVLCLLVILFFLGCDKVTEKELAEAEKTLETFVGRMEDGKTTREEEQKLIRKMDFMLSRYLEYLKKRKDGNEKKIDGKNQTGN